MSNFTKLLQQASAGNAGEALAIEDVFSTYLHVGDNNNPITITNDIDLLGEGGLVWFKNRDTTQINILQDTDTNKNNYLSSNLNSATTSISTGITSFNNDGFTVGSTFSYLNTSYVSWTFRKAPRFFDIVRWTGDSVSGRQISHNLGIEPGCIIVKNKDTNSDWAVFHNGITGARTDALFLNKSDIKVDSAAYWDDTNPTDTVFTVGNDLTVNASGDKYVAYLFADDPLGPSGDGSDGLIATGNYTGTGSSTPITVTLGWEPQWLLIKTANTASRNWSVIDIQRGMDYSSTRVLKADLSDAETSQLSAVRVLPDGFQITTTDPALNETNAQMIYIAIRRGPMRQPESGAEVFKAVYGQNTDTTKPAFISDFVADLGIRISPGSSVSREVSTRITGPRYLMANKTDLEYSRPSNYLWDYSDGFATGMAPNNFAWMWRRAPGYFDCLTYTGTGTSTTTVPHNLGVVPQLIIAKPRDALGRWAVLWAGASGTFSDSFTGLSINDASAALFNGSLNYSAYHTDTVFAPYRMLDSAGSHPYNTGTEYIAYLFAGLPGISKVGTYTGNGSTGQTINCDFTTGARFVLVKRTDTTGDWFVFDTTRGITSGNDAKFRLNDMSSEDTTNDWVDPNSSGFYLDGDNEINRSGGTYIFYAIA